MNEIIYVACPSYYKTGGTELAHQLVFKLNNFGKKATIAYTDSINGEYINPAFREYVSEYVLFSDIPDNNNSIIVIPETMSICIEKYSKAKIFLWWMSVDNYYHGQNFSLQVQEYGYLKALFHEFKYLFRLQERKEYLAISNMQNVYMHLVQSTYAKEFLYSKGIKNVIFLSDYINRDYVVRDRSKDRYKKENIVIYNPKKGKHFTRKIIKKCKNIRFIPLENMTNEEVIGVMKRAKIYIDFGPHPGKDRMPREAAMMHCCILTGRRGSADYDDIPIPEEFKIRDKTSNLKYIFDTLNYMIDNYDDLDDIFEDYRKWIRGEEDRFNSEIKKVFEIEG